MAFVMGIDIGTSSLKTILMRDDGKLIGIANEAYQFDSPRPGFAEQDPNVWRSACFNTIKSVIAQSKIDTDEIKGLSFSGQMHGLVALDENYCPVRPAILHCDTRSTQQVQRLRRSLPHSFISAEMLNPIYPGFLLPSLLWIRDNEPKNFARIKFVCLPKDYVKMRLSGVLISDYSDASGTLAFSMKSNDWFDEILSTVDLSREIFPRCVKSAEIIGNVSPEAARETGLSAQTLVIEGAGDLVMQSIGSGMVKKGNGAINIGSSGQVCFPADSIVSNPVLNTNFFCSYDANRWILYGATMNAGLSLKWWRSVTQNQPYALMEQEISQIEAGSGGVLFLPYLNGERCPHLNPNIGGAFFGLTSTLTLAHMTRAVMEGVAYSLFECAELCGALGFTADSYIAAGGGARSETWLQIQADIFGKPVRVNQYQEQACLGAAITAATGCGIFSSIESGCDQIVKYQDKVYYPNPKTTLIYKNFFEYYKKVYRDSARTNEELRLFTKTLDLRKN